MKKIILTLTAIIAFGFITKAQNVNIPDANFKAYLVGNTAINTNGDTEIQVSEATAFTGTIDCSSSSISDLTGIEAFTALTSLNCYGNQLTSLDVSNNTALTYLSSSGNQLSYLDISQNTLLETLGCGNNQLTSLNVFYNTNLTDLHVYQNSLRDLDVSNNSSLTYLNCVQNSLEYLNVANGNNSAFTGFDVGSNPNLTCINVDNASYSSTNWTSIDPASSFSTTCPPCTVNIPDANFKAYLVGNTAINTNGNTEIECSEANSFSGTINLTSSGVADLTGIEEFINLDAFICNYNSSILNFDLSSNTELTRFDVYDAPLLTQIDLSSNTNITYLRLESCYNLTSMNISNCILVDTLHVGASTGFDFDFSTFPNLKWLNCYWTNPPANTFDLSSNPLLEFLDASYNSSMSALDLSSNTNLKSLNISNSAFTTVDYPYLTYLETLGVHDNAITTIDVSQNTSLVSLSCDENLITTLDVSNNVLLETLTCSDNQLSSLDVTQNTELKDLRCSENTLSTINLSQNNNLEILDIGSNQFTNFSVSHINNPNLNHLNCSNNQISDLDLSLNSSLTSVFCQNNNLQSLNVANGNNTNFVNPPFGFATPFFVINNPNLACIQVDDSTYSANNWTNIDPASSFSTNCGVAPCTINIPDANFKAYLVGNTAINTNGDTEIQCSEASAFTSMMFLNNLSVTDFTGLEAFINMTDFRTQNNPINTLDVSANTALTSLTCFNSNITSIDLSNNTLLETMELGNNSLTSLDVSNNANLVRLVCGNNQISTLNLSQNTALEELYIGGNSGNLFTNIDISNNLNLKDLNIKNNQITSLNLSNNLALERLWTINNPITSLDLSAQTSLIYLHCTDNNLTSLDLSNGNNSNFYDYLGGTGFNATGNPNLSCIQVDDATYSTTNWTDIDATASFSENCNAVSPILVALIEVQGQSGASTISTNGGTLQMFATVLPNNADDRTYTWSVNNSNASISAAGVLTALANGTVEVTATANDASGTTGSTTITISNQGTTSPVLVNSITVQGENGVFEITANGGTLQMEADVLPMNADDATYTWSVDNANASISTTGLLTALANGTVDVLATANDGSGVIGAKTITISNQGVGIKDIAFERLNVYPNPTTGIVNIAVGNEEITSIQVSDLAGRVVAQYGNESQINISNFTSGIYMLEVANEDKRSIVKLIVR